MQFRYPSYLLLLVAIYYLCTAPLVHGAGRITPFVETLQQRQAEAALKAAPSGFDAPADVRLTVVENVPVSEAPAETSVFEAQGAALLQAPTLREQGRSQAVETPLRQFGYELFSLPSEITSHNVFSDVPRNYIVGTGDQLKVQLYGKRNVEYQLTVTREGELLIPELGPMNVGGKPFEVVRSLIKQGFEERAIGAKAVVTIGAVRAIQVRVTGDVQQPGVYTLPGLASVIEALTLTGGIRPNGSMRDVQLRRGDRVVARIDLYDFLLKGSNTNDVSLRHGDVIFVPAIQGVVYVGGEVQRPAIYELKHEDDLQEVIALAGGLLATASLQDSHIERITTGNYRTIVDISGSASDMAVQAGDYVRILPVDDKLDGVVLLSGYVKRPGAFQHEQGHRVADILRANRQLFADTDLTIALLRREHPLTKKSSVTVFEPLALLTDPAGASNPLLQPRDEIRMLRTADDRVAAIKDITDRLRAEVPSSQVAPILSIQGHVRHPGTYPLLSGARLLDLVSLSGGLLPGTDFSYAVLSRPEPVTGRLRVSEINIGTLLADTQGRNNLPLAAGDALYLFNEQIDRTAVLQPLVEEIGQLGAFGQPPPLVTANGLFNHPGDYPLTDRMRVSDLVCAAAGLTLDADGVQLELTRLDGISTDQMSAVHSALAADDILKRCVQKRSHNHNAAQGAPVRSRIALDEHLETADPLLQPGDRITAVQRPDWTQSGYVELSGEVKRPGRYPIDRGERLCSVIQRAGGLTERAWTFGAEFSRRSVMMEQKKVLDGIQDSLDDLMVDLSLSHAYNNDSKTPAPDNKEDYLKVIKQLQRAEPSGRRVINLDEILQCRAATDLALEDGDRLHVPQLATHVYVAGQVYVPTMHLFDDSRSVREYIELSGGHTVLGRLRDAYVIQANGEVVGLKATRMRRNALRRTLAPGATVVVPLNVDRMNITERLQSWTRSLFEVALFAGVVI